jgi:uncharacterized iron-regulated membrane protein
MRSFWLVTHRWLGLLATPVLVVVGLTGAYLVWIRDERLGHFHANLALGSVGSWIVNVATLVGAFMVVGGLVLWWRRRIWKIDRSKGWWRFLFDLHHVLGVLGAGLMLVIALSGTALMMTEGIRKRRSLDRNDPDYPTAAEFRLIRTINAVHTARPFKGTFGIFWVICSAAFAIEGITGVVMWWKPAKGRDPVSSGDKP